MNNNIILAALQTQLETVKADASAHEQNVYQPAMAKLKNKIQVWFSNSGCIGIHDIELRSDEITIMPTDTTAYGNTIEIKHMGSWRKEGGYFAISSYRPDIDSTSDNTNAVHYYVIMAAIANSFDKICTRYENDWLPAIAKLNAAKSDKYNAIYDIQREIQKIERQLEEEAKQVYNEEGTECRIADYTEYKRNEDEVYEMVKKPHSIRAQHGRGRWDYYYIHSFKVIKFPKSKHGKVTLEIKGIGDDKIHSIELNKQRYADFISEVHSWNTTRAAEREAEIEERLKRWNKAEA